MLIECHNIFPYCNIARFEILVELGISRSRLDGLKEELQIIMCMLVFVFDGFFVGKLDQSVPIPDESREWGIKCCGLASKSMVRIVGR